MEVIEKNIKLDYSLETPEERKELVQKILDQTPQEKLTNKYLNILSDYIIFAMDKQERKNKNILTDNRMITINKRETSFENLSEKSENKNKDMIHHLIINDKNIIFTPKISITQKDIDTVPGLKDLRKSIEETDKQCKAATGRKKYLLKCQLIEMRRQQYILKQSHSPHVNYSNGLKTFSSLTLEESIYIDPNGLPRDSTSLVSLFNPYHISVLLSNYSELKQEVYGKFWADSYYLMEDLDNLIEKTLKNNYPYYYDLLILKIDKTPAAEIRHILYTKYNVQYTIEYISSLWRKKIPRLLAGQAQEDYLIWYYTYKERGRWKRCSRCGEVKLAHSKFFTKNKTSKDGFYSICKKCRSDKRKGG